MIKENKRLALNSISLSIRMFFIVIIGLALSRILLKNLGETDFGIYSVVGGIVLLIGFLNTVMASSTNRFMMVELGKKEDGDLCKIFSVTLLIHALLGIVIIILGETIGLFYVINFLNVPDESRFATQVLYQCSLIASAICVLQIPFQALLMSYENFTRFSIVQVAISFLMLVSAYLIGLYNNDRLIYFGIFMAISQIAGLILYYLLSLKYYPGYKRVREHGLFLEIRNFSTWIAVGALSSMGKTHGCNIILNYFFGANINASFGIASQVNTQMANFAQNISKAFSPQIMKKYVSDEKEKLMNLICASSKYSFFVVYFVALPFVLETEYILKLWLGEYPSYVPLFCRLVIVSMLVEKCNDGITPAVQASGRIKWFQIILSIISLSTLPISCLLFWLGYRPETISIIYIFTSIFNVIVRQILLKTILGFDIKQFLSRIYGRCLMVAIVTLPLCYTFHYLLSGGFVRLILIIFITLLMNLLAVYLLGMERWERCYINNYMSKRIAILKEKTRENS